MQGNGHLEDIADFVSALYMFHLSALSQVTGGNLFQEFPGQGHLSGKVFCENQNDYHKGNHNGYGRNNDFAKLGIDLLFNILCGSACKYGSDRCTVRINQRCKITIVTYLLENIVLFKNRFSFQHFR